MDWILKHLLIAEDRLRRAAMLRICIGVVAVVSAFTACQRGVGGGTYTFAATFMGGMHLTIFSLIALRWKRERGLWMMYSLLIVLALFMYSITLQAPTTQPGSPTAPLHPRTVAGIYDAVIGGSIFLMSVRLQASAAVANYRRFRPRAID